MLLNYNGCLFAGLLIISSPLFAGSVFTSSYAETAITPVNVARAQSGQHVELVRDFFAPQSDAQIPQHIWFSQDLLPSGASWPSEQRQIVFASTDSSFSNLKNPESPVGGNSVITYVPLPTTAWGFLIGLMTLLALSKRRNASRF